MPVEPEQVADPAMQWWIMKDKFFAQGGTPLIGPFPVKDQAFAMRLKVEAADPLGMTYCIDSSPAAPVVGADDMEVAITSAYNAITGPDWSPETTLSELRTLWGVASRSHLPVDEVKAEAVAEFAEKLYAMWYDDRPQVGRMLEAKLRGGGDHD